MNRALVVGASALGIIAVGWFGLNRSGDQPDAPDTSVIVDQVALSPKRDADDGAAGNAEKVDTDSTTAEAQPDATQPEAVEAEPSATDEDFARKTAEDVVAALLKPEEPEPLAKPEPVEQPEADAKPELELQPEGEAEVKPEPQPEANPEAEAKPEAEEQPAANTSLPRFDLVRVDADGQTIIAGKASPGESVEILLDGDVIATADADAAGAFVSILSTPLSGAAQQLQLRTVQVTATNIATENPPAEAARPEAAQPPETEATSTTQSDSALAAADPTEASDTTDTQAEQPDASAADDDPLADPVPQVTAPAAQVLPDADKGATAQVQEAEEIVIARADPGTAAQPREQPKLSEAEPAYTLSAPVIILPSTVPDQAPALVQPTEDRVALLQPQGSANTVTLDAINYGETGAVQLNGRGAPGNSVRIYGNGDRLGDTGIEDNGTWAWALARERALGIRLFRFDELDTAGTVASRIETPFTYEALSPKIVRQREVVIQRGDYLWRIAEQYYGEGIRFSLIYGANADLIRDPDLIYPGQVFSVPELVDAE